MSPGGSLFRGAALEVPDDSLEACPAAPTAPFNWVRFLVEGRELARWRRSAVGRGAVGAPRFPGGVVLLRVRGRCSAPFPAPARQSVHAVLPHTAYRRRSPEVFGLSRQGLPALGETTIPYRPTRPNSFGVKWSSAHQPKDRLRRWRLLKNSATRIRT